MVDAPSREITNHDLELVDRALRSHEVFQKDLYTLRIMLKELGKLNVFEIKRGVAAEEARLEETRKRADAA
jgi:hypothetical protein